MKAKIKKKPARKVRCSAPAAAIPESPLGAFLSMFKASGEEIGLSNSNDGWFTALLKADDRQETE